MLKYPCTTKDHQERYIYQITPFDEPDVEENEWSGKDRDVVRITCPKCRKSELQ